MVMPCSDSVAPMSRVILSGDSPRAISTFLYHGDGLRGALIYYPQRFMLRVHIWTRPRCQGALEWKHASGQMQPYIRPLGEDIPWSSGPDEICACSPHHDHGLGGPVPTQVGRKPV